MVGDLSVKGILRHHLGLVFIPGIEFPVGLLTLPFGFGDESLRVRLENLARTEKEYTRKEPPYGWKARFEQTWTHIRVRVKLKGKNKDADDAIEQGLDDIWRQGIERAWNGRMQCGAGDELHCRFSFEVDFVQKDEHHTVKVEFVKPGDTAPQTTMNHWNTKDDGPAAAHEYGHMIGKFDEYEDEVEAPGREEVNTGTVMDANESVFSPRQFTRFAANLDRSLYDIFTDDRIRTPY